MMGVHAEYEISTWTARDTTVVVEDRGQGLAVSATDQSCGA